MARLSFTETLVWHAIKGRVHNGAAAATDRLIAVETALPPSMVRTVRRDLSAAGLIECRVTRTASEWPDDELLITLRVPEKAAAS